MLGKRLSRTRLFLLVILAAILVIYAARFASMQFWATENPDAPDLMDFTLEVYGEPGGVEFEENSNPILPMFEPETGEWRLDGERLYDFASLVQGLEVGPHGSSPFVVANLPESATVDVYRKAIASLAAQGICRVGIYSPAPSPSQPSRNTTTHYLSRKGDTSVYHVLNVKQNSGASEPCRNRFPAWP